MCNNRPRESRHTARDNRFGGSLYKQELRVFLLTDNSDDLLMPAAMRFQNGTGCSPGEMSGAADYVR